LIVTHYFIGVGQDQEEDLRNFHLFLKYLIHYEHIDDQTPQAEDNLFAAGYNFPNLRLIAASITNLVEALDLHATFAARLSSFYDPPLQAWWTSIKETATISTIFDCSSLTPRRDDQTHVPYSAADDEFLRDPNALPQPIGNHHHHHQQQQQQQQPSATATKEQMSTGRPKKKPHTKKSNLNSHLNFLRVKVSQDSQASTGSEDGKGRGKHDVSIGHARAPNGEWRCNATQEPKSLKKLTENDWVVKFTGCKTPDEAYLQLALG